MRIKNRTRSTVFFVLLITILAFITIEGAMTADAADLEWNLLTDTEAGYRVEDRHRSYEQKTEADGTVYMQNVNRKSGALYIYDDNNILGTYRGFTLEGDFYFEAFPTGLRDGTYTPEERPLSFLCWVYNNVETGAATTFNALRIDSQGYLYTGAGSEDITDTQLSLATWYNIRCAFIPASGICEVFINDEKAFDFNYTRFNEDKYVSGSVRYFDGYYSWGAKMKNLYVKTDSNYTMELAREEAADYLGYQTSKPEDGTFSARVIFGVNGVEHRHVGYEIYRLEQDENGEVIPQKLSAQACQVYTTVKGGGKDYNVKDTFSYNYAAALTVSDLPEVPGEGGVELVVRPYVEGYDGIRRYGIATKILYTGGKDADGYPVFRPVEDKVISIVASDDTYIYNGGTSAATANYGAASQLMVRNTGDSKQLYRAAYYKFTVDAESVAVLSTATSAKLRVYCKGTETNAARKPYDMMVYATGTGWIESELNYQNHETLAPTKEQLAVLPQKSGYYVVDILSYLREQPKNADGSITVSFFFTNVGAKDALLSYFVSKEGENKPIIEISNSHYNTVLNLNKMGNEGYEPWGYAESIVNEWFDELVDQIYPKDENGNLIYYDIEDFAPEGYTATTATGDFTSVLDWKGGSMWSTSGILDASSFKAERFARTMTTLGKSTGQSFLSSPYADTISKYDSYGGITNAGFTGEATGFFHTEMIGGRYYIIDPLGNPYFAVGVNTVCLGDSANHKEYSLAKFGTAEEYYKQISDELKAMGINTAYGGDSAELLAVEDGLACVVGVSTVGTYMRSLGRSQISEGVFPFNNTINVFDPDFVTSSYESAAAKITAGGYAEMPNLFGYTTDNELPSGTDILDRYLLLDPNEEPTNSFSYAVAWTWLARRMNNPAPTLDDFLNSPEHDQMNSEFLGFLYGRNYRISGEAIAAADPNHMYIGSRVNGNCRTNEDYLRVAGYYLDIISNNLYGGLNPDAETMTNFYRYSGKPFIVTEFFAKALDAIDANGYRLANSTGSGILVKTQQDRADYYEHYALAMLECRGCVGWTWYRYRDNDQGIYVSKANPDRELIMLHVTYGADAKANSFMDADGNIYTAAQVGEYDTVYKGEPMMSNHNVNKGIFNSDFSSTVTVYTYDIRGNLIDFMGYEVEKPETPYPMDGAVLKASEGNRTFTLGTARNSDGTTTKTVLTVYEGKYIALSDSISFVSDHLMGLVRYFDEN